MNSFGDPKCPDHNPKYIKLYYTGYAGDEPKPLACETCGVNEMADPDSTYAGENGLCEQCHSELHDEQVSLGHWLPPRPLRDSDTEAP